MLRLPYELKDLMREWLQQHFPERAEHVMSLVRQIRGGKENDPRFGSRMHGEGNFAELIRQRFQIATREIRPLARPRNGSGYIALRPAAQTFAAGRTVLVSC